MVFEVGLDVRMAKHSGIGTYLRGTLKELLPLFESHRFSTGLFGDLSPESFPVQSPSSHVTFNAPIYSIQEQLNYPALLKQCKVWHAPHYNVPLFKGPTKLIVTIHDIIHWIFRKSFLNLPQAIYAEFMLRRAVQSSDHILTVSEHSKQDLITHFHADPKNITVTYEGVSDRYQPGRNPEKFAGLQQKHKLDSNYFLYVGLMKPHKNVAWLIQNLRRMRDAGKIHHQLVLVGQLDLRYHDLLTELSNPETRKWVRHVEGATGEDLQLFYQHAEALIHPSLYEGFGLTLLEAMASGAPVLAANTSSIPEVAGEAAILFDPKSEASLEQAISLIANPEFRLKLADKGLQNVKRFDWKKTAEQTFNIYQKVLEQS